MSHYSDNVNRCIFNDLKKLSPQILLHELGLRQQQDPHKAEKIVSEGGLALAVPDFSPHTMDGWKSLLTGCGYRITHADTVSLLAFNPEMVLKDEGPKGVARMAYNLAKHRDLRERVINAKAILASQSNSLGYILIRAVHDE